MVPFMPPGAIAMMVFLIEPPVITVTPVVIAPIGVGSMEIVPIIGTSRIPGVPLGGIPGRGSDDIGGSIGVIRGPAISGAEKVVEDAV
jgi:hypothetical protein